MHHLSRFILVKWFYTSNLTSFLLSKIPVATNINWSSLEQELIVGNRRIEINAGNWTCCRSAISQAWLFVFFVVQFTLFLLYCMQLFAGPTLKPNQKIRTWRFWSWIFSYRYTINTYWNARKKAFFSQNLNSVFVCGGWWMNETIFLSLLKWKFYFEPWYLHFLLILHLFVLIRKKLVALEKRGVKN